MSATFGLASICNVLWAPGGGVVIVALVRCLRAMDGRCCVASSCRARMDPASVRRRRTAVGVRRRPSFCCEIAAARAK